jgi:hypothetical protein
MSTQGDIAHAARGALGVQDLLDTLSVGESSPGLLLARMREAVLVEPAAYAEAFANELQKRLTHGALKS